MAVPIWKDYSFRFTSTDTVEYRIKVGSSTGAVIYAGKAYRRPGETETVIRVNDICAAYLQQNISGSFNPQSSNVTFYLERLNGATWQSAGNVTFSNDWSYDYSYNQATDGMAFPIGSAFSPLQTIYLSTASANVSVFLVFNDGTTQTRTLTATNGVASLNLATIANLKSVTYGGITHEIKDCLRYVLYYINAYGGWDTLAMAGYGRQKETFKRHETTSAYDNTSIVNRGQRDYVNEVTRGYSLNTGWLSDVGASRINHLIGSTNVYLADLETGEILPVVVDDNQMQVKSYATEGHQPISYDVAVHVAQSRVRR